jgi:hypothetical protein
MTRTWTTFFLSLIMACALAHAQAEYAIDEAAQYETALNVSCFDAYQNTVYFSASGNGMPYIYVLQYPSMQISERATQSEYVNCVNAMSDGRIFYSTPLAVYQTIPSLDTPFEFWNIKEIKDYKGMYIMLTGYNGIRGTDQNGNMTRGLPFAYASLNFTGIDTDGESIYGALNNGTVIIFNETFGETGRIEFGNLTANGISVYGKGDSMKMAMPTDAGLFLIVSGKQIRVSAAQFNRCVILNETLVACSDNSTFHFLDIVNVSEKAREYVNLSATLEKYIANATEDEYVIWARQQINLSESLKEDDIVSSLDIIRNISIPELQKRATKPAQNVTRNETVSNITTSKPAAQKYTPDLLMLGAIAVALIVALVAAIGIIAFVVSKMRHGEGKGQGPKYRFGS